MLWYLLETPTEVFVEGEESYYLDTPLIWSMTCWDSLEVTLGGALNEFHNTLYREIRKYQFLFDKKI